MFQWYAIHNEEYRSSHDILRLLATEKTAHDQPTLILKMNASALLTSQGWLGPGHALDTRLTDYGAQTYKQKGHRGLAYDPQAQNSSTQTSGIATGNGLVRPLLISQRHGLKHGIGKKVHEPASGNEWWLKGFASALANVGKSESERSSAVSSGTSTPRTGTTNGYVGKHSGLYNYFTSGTVMKGTIESSEQQDPETTNSRGKKRKSDVLEESNDTTTADPLAVSPVKRPQNAKELESSIPYLTERDRSRKKAGKHAKSSDIEAFALVGEFLGVTKDIPKTSNKTNGYHDEDETRDPDLQEPTEETKEERRARRRRRKEERKKEMKTKMKNGRGLSLAQMVEEELAKLSSLDNSEVDRDDIDSDAAAQKDARREARRKKRKEGKV